jgi:hypothetical protein
MNGDRFLEEWTDEVWDRETAKAFAHAALIKARRRLLRAIRRKAGAT